MPDAPTPVPAATILMLRDGSNGLETFMVVRHHQIDFASGALVFPGGKIDDADSKAREFCDGADGADDTTIGLMTGAIREAFEECGILLARAEGETDLVPASRLQELEQYREPLNNGDITMCDFLAENRLRLACDKLQHFAHWITPEMMPKRFDTHFYLAAAPADHVAIHDGHESVDSVWVTPSDAIKGAKDRTYTIIFPTLLNIQLLGESKSVESALGDAAVRKLVPVMPWTEQREDGNYLCIPQESPYAIKEQKLPPQAEGKPA